jgi:ribosome biogenesis protein ERB1
LRITLVHVLETMSKSKKIDVSHNMRGSITPVAYRGHTDVDGNNDNSSIEDPPDVFPVGDNSNSGDDDDDDSQSVIDSDVPSYEDDDSEDEGDDDSEEDFEDQGSSDDDEDLLEKQQRVAEETEDESDDEIEDGAGVDIAQVYESIPRKFTVGKRTLGGQSVPNRSQEEQSHPETSRWMHTDDVSSDDEDDDGTMNRIGRVPLHWYDDYDHIGYDAHGKKMIKSASLKGGDRLDRALANADNRRNGRIIVTDLLNDRNVELSARQLELIRRIQNGAFAHPEFDGNEDYVDYFSGVDPEISGINSNRYLPKSKFQPSKWEKLQVEQLLKKLEKGDITMDYLTGKVRDMNDIHRKTQNKDKPFLLWTGGEEDELNMKKGPQHIAAPKLPPPGHAESYIPPDEYLPTEKDLKDWEEMDPKDRPHGLLIPKKFPSLRSVGAYEHSVREAFERCLDLYLCPRVMKRRLNIDPESLVPQLPKASDLRPFPTAKCLEYKTPFDGEAPPMIRSVSCSPNGLLMASGASDGYVRLWEVATGRLLRSWNVSKLTDGSDPETQATDEVSGAPVVHPVVALAWNPNRSHHCLLAVVGRCAVIIATGTEGRQDADGNDALLSSALQGGDINSTKVSKAVQWVNVYKPETPVSTFAKFSGPVCVLHTKLTMTKARWHAKGDYFVTVSPKAAAAAVLIHQLSKGNSQQPFSKAKGEAQVACFHPNKPFLFVASQQHVRVYHLVKQAMVKRLISGCRWISSLDVHPSGDHLIVGSLDRRAVWFDLDLSHTPYKTLKYHERALRDVTYHHRYPLMASASDDGAVHIFHCMVYSDLMRNPLIVPVKILKGHTIQNKYGVLNVSFHPTQPWIFTAGADGRIFLYQDI